MTWIQTYSGKKFSLIDPQPEDVDITDVITALGNICRFAGHCRMYSVLQHSCHVAEVCEELVRFTGLMHDAPEAYYGDITRPQKIVLDNLSDGRISQWMKRIDAVVALALGYEYPIPAPVKHADNVLLATEARDLLGPPPEPWVKLPSPLPNSIGPMNAHQVYVRFVDMYREWKP